MLTVALLRRFAPNGKQVLLQGLVDGFPLMVQAGIAANTLRLCHFLAQLATETEFAIVEENMNYSAERLCQVWPTHFRTIAFASEYAHNPEKLADFIYADANRPPSSRLGNVKAGDGWAYRGRGYMQTTGRENYRRYGHEADPASMGDPLVSLKAAIEEWTRGHCNSLADFDDVVAIRKFINGGLTNLATTRAHLATAKKVFTEDALALPPSVPAREPPAVPAPTLHPSTGPVMGGTGVVILAGAAASSSGVPGWAIALGVVAAAVLGFFAVRALNRWRKT